MVRNKKRQVVKIATGTDFGNTLGCTRSKTNYLIISSVVPLDKRRVLGLLFYAAGDFSEAKNGSCKEMLYGL